MNPLTIGGFDIIITSQSSHMNTGVYTVEKRTAARAQNTVEKQRNSVRGRDITPFSRLQRNHDITERDEW